jgi:hypothetical protein
MANRARGTLRRKAAAGTKVYVSPANLAPLLDERQLVSPVAPYTRFMGERRASDDFRGIGNAEAFKLIAEEFKALSDGERKVRSSALFALSKNTHTNTPSQKYIDVYEKEKASYAAQFEKVYGRLPGKKPLTNTAS